MRRKRYRSRSRSLRHVPGQKPKGCFQERVKKVGPERFAIVAVDCGKLQARARVADFYGNVLLEPFTFEVSRPGLQTACAAMERTFRRHRIADSVFAIETTGRYHRPIKKCFAEHNWEPRDVHPFTSNLFRRACDESNKTDDTDLAAIHRAAVDGLSMRAEQVDLKTQQWRVLGRHRRDLVEKAATLKVQLKEAMHAYLPGYTSLWHGDDFWTADGPAAIAVHFDSPLAIQRASEEQFRQVVQEAGTGIKAPTIRRIQSWSQQAAPPDDAGPMYHRRARALWDDLRTKREEISKVELELADFLCDSHGVLLLAFAGIGIVSASDYAAELGLLTNYATSKSIAGRAGLYPSRYQTSDTDLKGPLSARRNRQLRAALMRVARNLVRSNAHFMGQARSFLIRRNEEHETSARVVVARQFSRLSYYLLAGEKLIHHAAIRDGEKILQKVLEFYNAHHSEPCRVIGAVENAIRRLRPHTLRAERQALAKAQQENQHKRRTTGVKRLGEILPAVLLRIDQCLEQTAAGRNDQLDDNEQSKSVLEDVTHGS